MTTHSVFYPHMTVHSDGRIDFSFGDSFDGTYGDDGSGQTLDTDMSHIELVDSIICTVGDDGKLVEQPAPAALRALADYIEARVDPFPVGTIVAVIDYDGTDLGPFEVVRSYWPSPVSELATENGMVRQNHDRMKPAEREIAEVPLPTEIVSLGLHLTEMHATMVYLPHNNVAEHEEQHRRWPGGVDPESPGAVPHRHPES